jgi:hypothetical protein
MSGLVALVTNLLVSLTLLLLGSNRLHDGFKIKAGIATHLPLALPLVSTGAVLKLVRTKFLAAKAIAIFIPIVLERFPLPRSAPLPEVLL